MLRNAVAATASTTQNPMADRAGIHAFEILSCDIRLLPRLIVGGPPPGSSRPGAFSGRAARAPFTRVGSASLDGGARLVYPPLRGAAPARSMFNDGLRTSRIHLHSGL